MPPCWTQPKTEDPKDCHVEDIGRLALFGNDGRLLDCVARMELKKACCSLSELSWNQDGTTLLGLLSLRKDAAREKQLCSMMTPLVKVLWHNQHREEATWERGDEMRMRYAHLFYH